MAMVGMLVMSFVGSGVMSAVGMADNSTGSSLADNMVDTMEGVEGSAGAAFPLVLLLGVIFAVVCVIGGMMRFMGGFG